MVWVNVRPLHMHLRKENGVVGASDGGAAVVVSRGLAGAADV